MADYDTLAKTVGKLYALLNDRHPELKSWRWLAEHTSCEVVQLLLDAGLLTEDGEVEEEDVLQ